MEAFSLLKYWRGGGGGGVFTRDAHCNPRTAVSSSSFSSSAATVVTTVTPSSSSSDSDDEGNDDGPFFDLEFTLPDDDDDDDDGSDSEDQADDDVTKVAVVEESENVENSNEKGSSAVEGDVSEDDDQNNGTAEINFTISPSSDGDSSNAATFSSPPGNDLFFPMDSSSVLVSAASETIPKFPVSSILKSATKFRVQMLKFNKSKSGSRQKDRPSKSEAHERKSAQKIEQQLLKEEGREDPKPNSKLLTVKLKVEEVMPLVSLLFTREHNSSTNSKGTSNSKANKRNGSGVETNTTEVGENITGSTTNEEEKKFAKELMNKYLKKVKPLYVRVSKRYGDKLKFSGQLSFPKPAPPDDAGKPPAPVVNASEEGATEEAQEAGEVTHISKGQKQGNLQAGLRVVCKHLGKSRSASASVAAPAPSAAPESSKRRDDSLLQQQDGIQSAILHCKRSFNASRDMEGSSILSRSVSDSLSSHENR